MATGYLPHNLINPRTRSETGAISANGRRIASLDDISITRDYLRMGLLMWAIVLASDLGGLRSFFPFLFPYFRYINFL